MRAQATADREVGRYEKHTDDAWAAEPLERYVRQMARRPAQSDPVFCAGRRRLVWGVASFVVLLACVPAAIAQDVPSDEPPAAEGALQLPQVREMLSRDSLSNSLQILVLLTVLTVLPSIVLMTTSFVRMLVVLVLLRQALGTQQLPPSQVLVGLALFMTVLVMAPTWERINDNAIQPYLREEMDQLDALGVASQELRGFMFKQIAAAENEQDVYMMYEYAKQRAVADDEVLDERDIPTTALIPAFILSELKTSFIIGFRIYLPFLVIDMVIATVLVSMGMMMLPPVLISLPFKLLLFVLADGWHLVAGSLMASVQ